MPLSTESVKHEDSQPKAAPKAKPGTLAAALNEATNLEDEKRAEDKRQTAASAKFQEKYNRLPIGDEIDEFLDKK